jgi:hypothetical protein
MKKKIEIFFLILFYIKNFPKEKKKFLYINININFLIKYYSIFYKKIYIKKYIFYNQN